MTGAGGFVGAHVDAALRAAGHEAVDVPVRRGHAERHPSESVDAIIHLTAEDVRACLDDAYRFGARLVVLMSAIGADPHVLRRQLRAHGKAEELVRASGLPWVILRPEILWGPGDVFTNQLVHLMRHLPFVPIPRGGRRLFPVHVGDAARALVECLERRDLWYREWSLLGPEPLSYAEVVERIAQAIYLSRRRKLRVPGWSVRLGAAIEERVSGCPSATRALLDRYVAGEIGRTDRLRGTQFSLPQRLMSVEELRAYLWPARPPREQLGTAARTFRAAPSSPARRS
ncbi:MAG: NAD(P)H-binding protein [Deltaproteobacteria bacterium]|nr:NAD(P)H-binding protein [Deltaproteobacteria bacterium]